MFSSINQSRVIFEVDQGTELPQATVKNTNIKQFQDEIGKNVFPVHYGILSKLIMMIRPPGLLRQSVLCRSSSNLKASTGNHRIIDCLDVVVMAERRAR